MNDSLHLGIGHYGIGFQDGVNTVIARNVRALVALDPSLHITLFGKLSPHYQDFIRPKPATLHYCNIEEFDPNLAARRLGGRSISEQQVHDYIWQGTNIAELLELRLAKMDVVMIENLGIGVHPAVTYAFYLYVLAHFTARDATRFIFRVHDFAQQRPANFRNVRKFHHPRFGSVPNWHTILYPAYPNVRYIAVNRYDRWRLLEHGIDETNVFYIPNSVDQSIIPSDDKTLQLRHHLIRRRGLDPSVRFLFYPVRCVPRKNVEEALFLTQLFNALIDERTDAGGKSESGRFHLLVSLRPISGVEAEYASQVAEFAARYELPVTIGLNDLVSLQRETDPSDSSRIRRYGIGDIYRVADLIVTTSVLEGFGFVYVEPWLLDRAVIGRSIPFVTPDFQAAGMQLGHLYSALLVEGHDFKDIGRGEADDRKAVQLRLNTILRLRDLRYLRTVIQNNEVFLLAARRLFAQSNRRELIARNKKIVTTVYSQECVGRQLYQLITTR